MGRWKGLALAGAMLASAPTKAATPLSLEEAIRVSLDRHPDVLDLRARVDLAKGDARTAGGPFDYNVDISTSYSRNDVPESPAAPVPQETDDVSLNLGLAKQFRIGTTITPRVQLQRLEILQRDVPFPDGSTNDVSVGPLTNAFVTFEVTQPLLRDLGLAVSAPERAARVLVNAARRDFDHGLAVKVRSTASAYFNYTQAHLALKVLEGAEDRFERLYANVEELVKADERPRAELLQISANLANRRRSRIAGQRSLEVARFRLGLEMGLNRQEIEEMGPPSTGLPVVVAEVGGIEPLLTAAGELRQDLEAARLRVRASQLLLQASENARLPGLDLTGSIGYAGSVDGGDFTDFWLPLGDGIPGPTGSVRLVFEWPVLNAQRGGARDRARAALQQAEIALAQVERELAASTQIAHKNAGLDAKAHEQAVNAVELFDTAVKNEREKLRLGLATVIDAVLTEDRLTTALEDEISAHAQYALSVIQLRFETGTLVLLDIEGGRIDPTAILQVPRGR